MASVTDKVTTSFLNLINKDILKPLSVFLSELEDLSEKTSDELFDLMTAHVSVKKEKKTKGKVAATPKVDPVEPEVFAELAEKSAICAYGFKKGKPKGKLCATPVGDKGLEDRRNYKNNRCAAHVGKEGVDLFKTKGQRRVMDAAAAAEFVSHGISAVSPSNALRPPKIIFKKYKGLRNEKNGDKYTDRLSEHDGSRHFVVRDQNGLKACVGKIVDDLSETKIDPLSYEKQIVALDKDEEKKVKSLGFKYELHVSLEASDDDSDDGEDILEAVEDKPKKKKSPKPSSKPAKPVSKPASDSDDSDDDAVEEKPAEKPAKKKKSPKEKPPKVEKEESVEEANFDTDTDDDTPEPVKEKKPEKKKVKESKPKKSVQKEPLSDSSDSDEDVLAQVEEKKPSKKAKVVSDDSSDSDDDVLEKVEEVKPAKDSKKKAKAKPKVVSDSSDSDSSDEDIMSNLA